MKFKVINFLGDSITEGACASSQEKRFSTLLCKLLNCKENNYGVGGSRIAKQTVPFIWGNDEYFYPRALKMDKSANFTFIFGGTNDFGHGDAPFGKFGDKYETTFYGALDQLLSYIASNFDKNKLCFILPIPRFKEEEKSDLPKADGFRPLEEYRKAIINVCKKYGIDTYRIKSIPEKASKETCEYLTDGLHPNDKGYELIANELYEYLQNKTIK